MGNSSHFFKRLPIFNERLTHIGYVGIIKHFFMFAWAGFNIKILFYDFKIFFGKRLWLQTLFMLYTDEYKIFKYWNEVKIMKNGLNIGAFDTKQYYLNDKLHRVDGPAIEYANGSTFWYLNGKRHREDGPAKIWANGAKYWYLHGKRHREDGPAVELANGTTRWYLHGKKHRVDGPAEEWADSSKAWYLNGKKHRVDGPAEEYTNGTKRWFLHGKLHSVDGPAILYSNGTKAWYLHGKRHSVDGPAIVYSNGGKRWFLHGKRHRVDGPAVEWSDGTKEWYFNNEQLVHPKEFKTMEAFIEKLNSDENYSFQWINDIKYLIEFINNPTDKQKRLHAMKWKI